MERRVAGKYGVDGPTVRHVNYTCTGFLYSVWHSVSNLVNAQPHRLCLGSGQSTVQAFEALAATRYPQLPGQMGSSGTAPASLTDGGNAVTAR